jgi:MFS family permease
MWSMLRSNRDIRALFSAHVVSFAGDWFAYVAFVGLVQDLTDSPILVTMVYVTQALPAFLMSPITGPTADRRDRRRVIQTASLLQSLAAAGLLLVDSRSTLWIGYLCLCLISALGAFVPPAGQAGLPNLARDPDELRRASILFGSLWGTMLAVGAALGGLVASVFGREAAFVANIVSFVAAAALVTTIRRPMQVRRVSPSKASRMRPIADMGEALSHARRDTVLMALLASKATFAIGAGIVGLLAVLATEELHGGDGATGLLLGARGVGVALGPVIAARLIGPSLSRLLLMCGCSGLVFGVFYLGLSVAPVLAVAVPLVLLAHLGGGAQWTLSTYGLQRRAPDQFLGRILAGDFGMVTLIITLSNVAAGALAGWAGPRWAIATFALLGLTTASAYLVLTRPVRARLDATESPAAAAV